jgi:hypothetical protein
VSFEPDSARSAFGRRSVFGFTSRACRRPIVEGAARARGRASEPWRRRTGSRTTEDGGPSLEEATAGRAAAWHGWLQRNYVVAEKLMQAQPSRGLFSRNSQESGPLAELCGVTTLALTLKQAS